MSLAKLRVRLPLLLAALLVLALFLLSAFLRRTLGRTLVGSFSRLLVPASSSSDSVEIGNRVILIASTRFEVVALGRVYQKFAVLPVGAGAVEK